MQGINADSSSVVRIIKDNEDDSGSVSKAKPPKSAGVSIAYAEGIRQPILTNANNLFRLMLQTCSNFSNDLLGGRGASDDSSIEADNNDKDRDITFYCLPCLSCGHGEQGRATVRLLAMLCFPMCLLSFFLMNNIGHTIMRNIRLRHVIATNKSLGSSSGLAGVGNSHYELRRHSFIGPASVNREVLWVPLHTEVNVEQEINVDAELHCPKGVLFLFHGCGRYAASFFYSPQGRKIVQMAYNAGVEVVTFEKHEELGCWDYEKDGKAILKVGRKFMTSRLVGNCGMDYNGNNIYPPIWAFGASSGGQFIAKLASEMERNTDRYSPFLFAGLNIQIMAPNGKIDWNIPTIFTVMEGDPSTKARVQQRIEKNFQGGSFKMITTSGNPKSINPDHFSRVYADDEQMTDKLSHEIYDDLVEMGVVDSSNNNHLSDNPRSANAVMSIWQKHDVEAREIDQVGSEKKALPFGLSQQLVKSLKDEELDDANSLWLIEELNVAFDQHEITAEGFDEVLSFFFEYGRDR